MIKDQVAKVKESLKDFPNVRVVAATKYLDVAKTQELIDSGITEIGENRIDSFDEKYEKFGKEVIWHFFGVLQARKVRMIINKINYLHSLDSLSLANEINKKRTSVLDCFVQVNISCEPNKAGLDETKVVPFIKNLSKFPKIRVIGLMTIAKMTFDKDIISQQFAAMKKLRDEVIALGLPYAPCTELSMGMSNDYLIACECGATVVRLGRIFLE